MELSRLSTIIIVLLVCFLCQVRGDTKEIPKDEASQNSSDDFTSGYGDIDKSGQYELIVV